MAMPKTINEIGLIALELHQHMKARKAATRELKGAYRRWAEQTQTFHQFDRDSEEWKQMMIATDPEYQREQNAKRFERNTLRRLHSAIAKGVRV